MRSSWVLYYCRKLWKARLWMFICQWRIFAALLQSWLCVLVWDWLVNGAARLLAVFSSAPDHIPGQFGDFPPRTRPLHLIINWWVQSGSLQRQENHRVLACGCVRAKPGKLLQNPLTTASSRLNRSVILINESQFSLERNRQGFVSIQNSSDKRLERFRSSSAAGQLHFWISLESWKLPLYCNNTLLC